MHHLSKPLGRLDSYAKLQACLATASNRREYWFMQCPSKPAGITGTIGYICTWVLFPLEAAAWLGYIIRSLFCRKTLFYFHKLPATDFHRWDRLKTVPYSLMTAVFVRPEKWWKITKPLCTCPVGKEPFNCLGRRLDLSGFAVWAGIKFCIQIIHPRK